MKKLSQIISGVLLASLLPFFTWIVISITTIQGDLRLNQSEMTRLREDVKSAKKQFDGIMMNLAYERAKEILRSK